MIVDDVAVMGFGSDWGFEATEAQYTESQWDLWIQGWKGPSLVGAKSHRLRVRPISQLLYRVYCRILVT